MQKFEIDELKLCAERSHSPSNHKIGAVLVCEDGSCFFGFTVRRSSVLGSTCAERMALDNWYQSSRKSKPVKIILTGKIARDNFDESCIVYPCGSCREMYHQLCQEHEINDFIFECYSWDMKACDRKKIKDLLFYGKPFYE